MQTIVFLADCHYHDFVIVWFIVDINRMCCLQLEMSAIIAFGTVSEKSKTKDALDKLQSTVRPSVDTVLPTEIPN